MSVIEAIKTSPVFMNAIFDQMHAAVFIIDPTYKVMAFNNAFKSMVGLEDAQIENHLCGNVLGCYYSWTDNAPCGTTEYCKQCELRRDIKTTLETGLASSAKVMEREFVHHREIVRKYFRYTIKSLHLEELQYALLIIDDVTNIEEKKAAVLEQNAEITKLNDKFQRDLTLAKRVQESIIPKKSLRLNGYTIDFRYFPLDVIGGDMFDIYVIDNSRVGILMCDVVGHGLPAALITTMIKALVEGSRHLLDHPKAFIRNLNRRLIAMLGEVYLTAIYGVLDTEDHIFKFVRAGHPHPWQMIDGEVHSVGESSNMMLGVDDSTLFLDDFVDLKSGSNLLLFTDGLLEAQTEQGAYELQLWDLLKQNGHLNAEVVTRLVDEDLLRAFNPQKHEDDICFLVIGRDEIG